MPQTTLTTLWDGTDRPDWAGQASITYQCAVQNASYSDARYRNVRRQKRAAYGPANKESWACSDRPGPQQYVPRPTSVTGIVVPVSTAGHKMVDVPARNLAGTGLQRGHVLAASLGGTDIPENMVPQSGIMNTNNPGCGRSPLESLKWRELEQVTVALALLGWSPTRMTRHQYPAPNDDVELEVFAKGRGRVTLYNRTSDTPKAGPINIAYPDPKAIAGKGAPLFAIQTTITLTYPSPDRDNWPSGATVTLTLREGSEEQELASIPYRWDTKPSELPLEEWRDGAPSRKRQRLEDELDAARLYKIQRGVRGYVHTIGDADDDDMDAS